MYCDKIVTLEFTVESFCSSIMKSQHKKSNEKNWLYEMEEKANGNT